jgi:hypothetical protein
LDRLRRRGDGGHDRSRAQQFGSVFLVVEVDVEDGSARQAGEGRQDPGGERVGVDGNGDARRTPGVGSAAQPALRVCGQHVDLPGEPQHRVPRLGDPNRFRALHEHGTHRRLEGLDALAHGTGRDMQFAGRRLEAALGDGIAERAQLGEVELHD